MHLLQISVGMHYLASIYAELEFRLDATGLRPLWECKQHDLNCTVWMCLMHVSQ